jgi:hypothetical protein
MWRELTAEVARQPLALEVAGRTGLIDRLREMAGLLDTIQKGLNLFLNFKRGQFPRMVRTPTQTHNPIPNSACCVGSKSSTSEAQLAPSM